MFLSDFLFRVLFQVASCFLAASLLQGLLKAEPQGQIRPVRKTKNHFHSQCEGASVCALLRASGRAFAVRVFAENISAHFGEFPQNFRKMSATFAGAVETILDNFPQKFPQNFRNFSKCSLQCVGGGDRVKLSVW